MNMATESYDYLFELLLIGDSGVGKTSILSKFSEDTFSLASIYLFLFKTGIDFKIKTIEVDGKIIKLQVWDAAARERFRTITTTYYRGAMGIMLVYDVTNMESFENIRNWIKNIKILATQDVEFMILGNKCDIADKRHVSKEKGEQLSLQHSVKFMETSAKTNINIGKAFIMLTRTILMREANRGPLSSRIINFFKKCCPNYIKSSKCSGVPAPVRSIACASTATSSIEISSFTSTNAAVAGSRINSSNSILSKHCSICLDRPINCVLYQCGHMCTCYECGVSQWKSQSRTCPICRAFIKDVIRTYKSYEDTYSVRNGELTCQPARRIFELFSVVVVVIIVCIAGLGLDGK